MKNEYELLNSKLMRENHIGRVEVLDKVGELLLMPNTELTTLKMVSDFYLVSDKVIEQVVNRHKEELESDGFSLVKQKDVLNILNVGIKNIEKQKGKMIATFENDGGTVNIPSRGLRLFTKRSVLRVGMLLRDSEVAREVRTQLLNIEEKTDNNTKLQEIDKEKELLMAIMFAKSETERAIAVNQHLQYVERYKEQAKKYVDIYNSDTTYTSTQVAKDLGMSAQRLHSELHELGYLYKKSNTWFFYSKHEHMIPNYADYKITEHGQLLKWTNAGREWVINTLRR